MTVLQLFWQILTQYCKFLKPRPLKQGILGASAIILSKDYDKYAFMCGSNFYESDVIIIYSSTIIGKCKVYF